MMHLMTFAIYTLLFVMGGVGVFKFLLYATQKGQFLGKWQNVLDWLYSHNMKNTEKLLGGCAMCFAHFISVTMFVVYVAMLWDLWIWNWWQSIVWYFVFVGMSWFNMLKQIPKNKDNSPVIKQSQNGL